jgi:hypothetical protein
MLEEESYRVWYDEEDIQGDLNKVMISEESAVLISFPFECYVIRL